MSTTTLSQIDVGGSVLFLGSGFSQGAINIAKKKLVTGRGLKTEFAQLLGVHPDTYDLKTLADEVASRANLNLYQLLYNLFTVKELQRHQTEILRLQWMRIYTTNYDDAAEYGQYKNHVRAPSYSYDDVKPRKLARNSIIHLHGVIRKTTENNVLQQLILNESSYVRQHFEKSVWYDEFDRDLRFCSACFFLGYSLSDYHITALLMQNPQVRAKTYFVTSDSPAPIFANRVEP